MNQLGPLSELFSQLGLGSIQPIAIEEESIAADIQDLANELVKEGMKIKPGDKTTEPMSTLMQNPLLQDPISLDNVTKAACQHDKICTPKQGTAVSLETRHGVLKKMMAAINVKYFCLMRLYPACLRQEGYDIKNPTYLKYYFELCIQLRAALSCYAVLLKANYFGEANNTVHLINYQRYARALEQLLPGYHHILLYMLNHQSEYDDHLVQKLLLDAREVDWLMFKMAVENVRVTFTLERRTTARTLYLQDLFEVTQSQGYKAAMRLYCELDQDKTEHERLLTELVKKYENNESRRLASLNAKNTQFRQSIPWIMAQCHYLPAQKGETQLLDDLAVVINQFKQQPTLFHLESIFNILLRSASIGDSKELNQLLSTAAGFINTLSAVQGLSVEGNEVLKDALMKTHHDILVGQQFFQCPAHTAKSPMHFRLYSGITLDGLQAQYRGYFRGHLLALIEQQLIDCVSQNPSFSPTAQSNELINGLKAIMSADLFSQLLENMQESMLNIPLLQHAKEDNSPVGINHLLKVAYLNHLVLYQLAPSLEPSDPLLQKYLYNLLFDIESAILPLVNEYYENDGQVDKESYPIILSAIDTFNKSLADFERFAEFGRQNQQAFLGSACATFHQCVKPFQAVNLVLAVFRLKLMHQHNDLDQSFVHCRTALVKQLESEDTQQCYQKRFGPQAALMLNRDRETIQNLAKLQIESDSSQHAMTVCVSDNPARQPFVPELDQADVEKAYIDRLAYQIDQMADELVPERQSARKKAFIATHHDFLSQPALVEKLFRKVQSLRQQPVLDVLVSIHHNPLSQELSGALLRWININYFMTFTLCPFDPKSPVRQRALFDLNYDLAYWLLHFSGDILYLFHYSYFYETSRYDLAYCVALMQAQTPGNPDLIGQYRLLQYLGWSVDVHLLEMTKATHFDQLPAITCKANSRYRQLMKAVYLERFNYFSSVTDQVAIKERVLKIDESQDNTPPRFSLEMYYRNLYFEMYLLDKIGEQAANQHNDNTQKLFVKLDQVLSLVRSFQYAIPHEVITIEDMQKELIQFWDLLLQVKDVSDREALSNFIEKALLVCQAWRTVTVQYQRKSSTYAFHHAKKPPEDFHLLIEALNRQVESTIQLLERAHVWLQGPPVDYAPLPSEYPPFEQVLAKIDEKYPSKSKQAKVNKRETKWARLRHEVMNVKMFEEPIAPIPVPTAVAKSIAKPVSKPIAQPTIKLPAKPLEPINAAVVTPPPATTQSKSKLKQSKNQQRREQRRDQPVAPVPKKSTVVYTSASVPNQSAWADNFVEKHFPLPKQLPTLPSVAPSKWDSAKGSFAEQFYPKVADSADDISLKLATTQLNSWENRLQVPDDVKTIMQNLKTKGCYAMIMGGFVRDRLMNKTPNDIDMIVWGKMDEIKEAVGEGFTLTKDGHQLVREGTKDQFRIELSTVEVGKPLKQICLERDFTINTLGCALNDQNEMTLVDELGYVSHIHVPYLVLVNHPDDFRDPAKILRLIRLSNELGLLIHPFLIPYAQYYGQFIYSQMEFGPYMGNIDALFWRGKATEQLMSLVGLGLLPYLLPFRYQSYDSSTYQLINSFVLTQCLAIDNELKPANPTPEQRVQRRERVVALLLLAELVYRVRMQKTDVEQARQDLVVKIFGKFQGVAYQKLGDYYQAFCDFERDLDKSLDNLNANLSARKAARAALCSTPPVFSPGFQQSLAPGAESNDDAPSKERPGVYIK